MPLAARVVLETAAALVTLGGLYDLLTPKLPPNLAAMCGGNKQAIQLARQLLRALGGALVSIGIVLGLLAATPGPRDPKWTAILMLALVLPSEGINSVCMSRVGSPFFVPLSFALLTLVGVLLSWPGIL